MQTVSFIFLFELNRLFWHLILNPDLIALPVLILSTASLTRNLTPGGLKLSIALFTLSVLLSALFLGAFQFSVPTLYLVGSAASAAVVLLGLAALSIWHLFTTASSPPKKPWTRNGVVILVLLLTTAHPYFQIRLGWAIGAKAAEHTGWLNIATSLSASMLMIALLTVIVPSIGGYVASQPRLEVMRKILVLSALAAMVPVSSGYFSQMFNAMSYAN